VRHIRLLTLLLGAIQLSSAEPLTFSNLPLGSEQKPLILRTYMPDPGLDAGYFANHGKSSPSPKYNPTKGEDVKGEYVPIKGLPAAIGVNHGPALSYAFDTVECRIAYAWQGGFLDMYPYWGDPQRGNRLSNNYVPYLTGTLFYKAGASSEIFVDGKPLTDLTDPKYIGYDIKDGAPVFTYSRGGKTFTHSLVPNKKTPLSFDFTISSPDAKSITFGKDGTNPNGNVLKHTFTGEKIRDYQGFPRDLKIKTATVANGQILFENLGCSACHSIDGSVGHGPTLAGLFGSERMIEGSPTPIKADAAYILESIKAPNAKTAKNFPPNYMPPYQLSDPEYDSLNLYIQSVAKGE
jgi:mono/diheme cytochrome c family protein